jgi:hypothetical protein
VGHPPKSISLGGFDLKSTNKLPTLAFLILLALTMSVLAQDKGASLTTDAKFSLSITVAPANAKPGEDVIVTVLLRNTSDSFYELPVTLEAMHGEINGFIATVTDASGVVLPRGIRPEDQQRKAESRSVAGLNPGQTYKDRIDLSKLFDLSEPGTYQVKVHRIDRQTNVKVYSNVITLTVVPR